MFEKSYLTVVGGWILSELSLLWFECSCASFFQTSMMVLVLFGPVDCMCVNLYIMANTRMLLIGSIDVFM